MDPTTIKTIADMVDIFVKIAALIGGFWAIYKVIQFRELKQRIQLDIDANMYRLASPEQVETYNWDKTRNRMTTPVQPRTHAFEILLKFANKGFTRMRLFNIQIGVNTMRPQNEAEFDEVDGHLHLTRIFTSGNIVPIFRVEDRPSLLIRFISQFFRSKSGTGSARETPPKYKPVEKTSFYYIEPGIEQTITYLALITEPRELIQIFVKFSLEQERIFPSKDVGSKGVYPHTAARTYKIGLEGSLIK